ncbi:MAG: 50S ribosomal protein L11 methyltransferase [Alphaproteobacteria bacterium]|nr:50S ribosomal protein L11 methyltransferase [Alphaproteobacteria bacterium]
MNTDPSIPWRLSARVRGAGAAAAVAEALDAVCVAVAAFETSERGAEWQVDAYAATRALTPELEIRLALTAAATGGLLLDTSETRLARRDWLADNQLAFPPLRIGRFFVHGSHHGGSVPAGMIGLEIDAATAFGTGEHPSTRGCLLALHALAKRRRLRRLLDIGTGTGILAIAAAKCWHRPVLAGDTDPGSVLLARHNTRDNGVAALVRVRRALGYRDRAFAARFDLVFANILARPLMRMARDLSGRLEPGGRAVLSGLLRRQEAMVLSAHRGRRLALERRLVVDGWSTLVLRSGARRSG